MAYKLIISQIIKYWVMIHNLKSEDVCVLGMIWYTGRYIRIKLRHTYTLTRYEQGKSGFCC